MGEKILTIVIAAYNKEDVLQRCLDSLIIDPYLMEKVQVLIVNDGSQDKTIDIAREYEIRYPDYFTVIDKENGNYGSVMNLALPLATGKYFRTLDADDWYDTKAYTSFLNELMKSDADMIISQRCDYLEDKKTFSQNTESFDENVTVNMDIPSYGVDWNNNSIKDNLNVPHITYKTSLIRESGLHWIEGIFYTDTMYDYWPLRLVKSVRFVPENVYIYLTGSNDQSMSPANIENNFLHFYKVATALIDDYKSTRDTNNPMHIARLKFISQIMEFVVGDVFTVEERKEELKNIYGKCFDIPELNTLFEKYKFYTVPVFKNFHKGDFSFAYKFFHYISSVRKKLG